MEKRGGKASSLSETMSSTCEKWFVLFRGCQHGHRKLMGCLEASRTCGKLSQSLGSHGNSWVLGDSGMPAKLQANVG